MTRDAFLPIPAKTTGERLKDLVRHIPDEAQVTIDRANGCLLIQHPQFRDIGPWPSQEAKVLWERCQKSRSWYAWYIMWPWEPGTWQYNLQRESWAKYREGRAREGMVIVDPTRELPGPDQEENEEAAEEF